MAFNSYSYLVALLCVVVCYWLIPTAWRKWFLLLCGAAFYASWSPYYIALPGLVGALAWWCARGMLADQARLRFWMRLVIVSALLLLAYFKYSAFLWRTLAGSATQVPAWLAVAMPLGISFYVFEVIGFLVDVKQKRVKAPALADVCSLTMFWPCLTSGPILRFRELVPQLNAARRFDLATAVNGIDRLMTGLVQKNFIANSLGSIVAEGFLPKAAAANSTLDNWAMAVAYGLQVYFDFAGYTNMAIGSARLLGLTLPENFRFPYHAANPSDFWSRWHMSLSRWIRDYLFFPINARYQGAPLPLYASLIGIMALVGLWHGAGWGFVAWGAMHGAYLVLYRVWERVCTGRPGWAEAWLARWGWRVLTLAAVTLAWVPFRAVSLDQSLRMLGSMIAGFDLRLSYNVNSYLVIALAALLCAVEPLLDALQKRLGEPTGAAAALRFWVWRPLAWACALLLFLIFDDRDAQFIYFQF
ncbi:MAG: MBOAT family protein [Acidobacteria bacterium]|nr:MBOAT family protein [Acidobacteriota bacterium]